MRTTACATLSSGPVKTTRALITVTNGVAKVENLLGFFIEGMCDDVYPNAATRPPYCGTNAEAQKSVVGRLMAYPGQFKSAAGSAGPSTFLKVVRLIR